MAIVDRHGNALRLSANTPTPYEAAGRGRRLRGWLAPGTGPNAAATGSSQTLRNRSRAQYRNNGYAQAGINRLVSNIIGTGIKPRSMAESKAFQRQAQSAWEQWGKQSDPEGQLGIYGQQAQAANTWLQGGECFIRLRDRRESDGLAVPMQVQVLEPEMCPSSYNVQRRRNTIRAGIEYNRIGRRVAYWFYKEHPGDMAMLSVDSTRLVRVPARDVIHLYDPIRPGQSRGIIKMAPVLMRMYDVDKYDDATLLRQQIANLFAAFIENPDEDQGAPLPAGMQMPDEGGDSDDQKIEVLSLEAGIMQELLPGQKVNFSDPPDAGSTYADFLRQQLMNEAAGLEVPYEVLTGDFSKINDRTARVLLNEFRRRVQQMQHHIVIHQMCQRIWADWWMPRAVLAGAVDAPGFANNQAVYTKARHIPQAWSYIHPVQDVQAQREAVRSGFKTRADVISETNGKDIDDVDAEQAAQNDVADSLGLVHDSDPRRTDGSGKRKKAEATEEQQEETT